MGNLLYPNGGGCRFSGIHRNEWCSRLTKQGFAAGITKLMPAAVFSLTGAGSEEYWQTYAAGIYRSRVMSGEDWAGGVTIEKPIPTAAQDCASRE